jgi:hypothetical protein
MNESTLDLFGQHEAEFLMVCIINFCDGKEVRFLDYDGYELLSYKQIESLFERIQDSKFAAVKGKN